MVKGGTLQPHWLSDGDSFWYANGVPNRIVIYRVDPQVNTKIPLFDAARLRRPLAPVLGHEPPYQGLPFRSFDWVDGESAVQFSEEGREFVCHLDSYVIASIDPPTDAEKDRTVARRLRRAFFSSEPDVVEMLSPDGLRFIGDREHNLYLRCAYDGRIDPAMSDGHEDHVWGVEGCTLAKAIN